MTYKIVKRADGTLETQDNGLDLTEAEIRENIARERAELRRMLDGNEQFHVDPMAAPKPELHILQKSGKILGNRADIIVFDDEVRDEGGHAIAAALPDWRPGDQVPKGERTGLWHITYDIGSKQYSVSSKAEDCAFYHDFFYRPAAPGVREDEAYDEARYAPAAQVHQGHGERPARGRNGAWRVG